jgi:hypothetical protein
VHGKHNASVQRIKMYIVKPTHGEGFARDNGRKESDISTATMKVALGC